MPLQKRKVAVLFLLGCLIAAQVHVLADLDPCLLKSGTAHNGASHNHRCQGCESGNLLVAANLPSLSPLHAATEIDPLFRARVVSEQRSEGRSPRAPPLA